MRDTVELYQARGEQITRLDSDYYGTGRKQGARHEVTARRPGRKHDGKWLTIGRDRKQIRVDTRDSRGNRPFSNSRDTRPTAKHLALREQRQGWSKARPLGLMYG
jgi:hypothetical protein